MSDPVAKIEATLDELAALMDGRQAVLLAKLRGRLEPLLDEARPPALNRPQIEWVQALKAQAKLDLDAASDLDVQLHGTVVAMLLQMVFEKLAKAYVAETNWPAFYFVRRSHSVAKTLTKLLEQDKRFLAKVVGPHVGPHTTTKLLPWIEALTNAHPALRKNGPHLEYPWEGQQEVVLPADLAIIGELRDPRSQAAVHLIKFAAYLIDHFDEITK